MRNSEADAENLINAQLRDKGWNETQISRQTHHPEVQRALGGFRPDYVLYGADSTRPLAVIEAKKPRGDLGKAIKQGLQYARKLQSLNCTVVFASDGDLVRSAHVVDGLPLLINGEEVKDILREKALRHFVAKRFWERGEVVRDSGSLISIFNKASRDLRSEGLVNIDAFAEFSQILFIKILSEIYDDDLDRMASFTPPPPPCIGAILLKKMV